MACEKGRATRPSLKLGVCGEHGGDPASIHFFQKVGLNYVSMSPYRVPVARLAAAQAAMSVKVGAVCWRGPLRPARRPFELTTLGASQAGRASGRGGLPA